MTTSVRLICVRHGPVRAQGLCYGRSDVETVLPQHALSAAIEELRGALRNRKAQLWFSPSERCRKLAVILARELSLPKQPDPRLQEMSFGAWEGRPYQQLEALPEFRHWMKNWKSVAPPGGETLAQLGARVTQWYRSLSPGPVHVAVTHAGVIRHLKTLLEAANWDDLFKQPIDSLTPIEFPEEAHARRP